MDSQPACTFVDIRRVKEFASRRLPSSSLLRALILAERNELCVEEYVGKVGVWTRMLKLESRRV